MGNCDIGNEPCIDVIIPTYNRCRYIKESIMSVLDQSYSCLEIYVIDDNSSDCTSDIVNSINDNRLHYYKNDRKMGANFSRNKGVALSSAPIIAFNDSDDIWEKDKLKKQISFRRREGKGLYFSPYFRIENDIPEQIVGNCKITDKSNIFKMLLLGNFIGTPTILIDRSIFNDIGGFDEELDRLQDWEFCLRVASKYNIFYTEEPLVTARRVDNSITESRVNPKKTFYKIADLYGEIIKKYNLVSYYVKLEIDRDLTWTDIKEFLRIHLGLKETEVTDVIIQAYSDIYEKNRLNQKYLDLIKKLNLNENKVTDILRKANVKSVAIYGNSVLGNLLADMCERNGIWVEVLIDRDKEKVSKYFTCNREKFLREHILNVDIVINTVPSLDNALVEMNTKIDVYNLSDMLKFKKM